MDIKVETGTEEQKLLIRKELEIVDKVSSKLEFCAPISQIIVPENFDAKINELSNNKNYRSKRTEHLAIAKNVFVNGQIFLIFSKEIYTNYYDYITRLQLYIHELFHAINKTRFPELRKESLAAYQSLSNLYILFDEYYSNRKSFEIVGNILPNTTKHYKKFHRSMLFGFLRTVIDNSNLFNKLVEQISAFRKHGNIDLFLNNVNPYFDTISKSIIYSFSYIDNFPRFHRVIRFLDKSKFINEKTYSLIEFYREKYKTNNTELFDGIAIIERFMENFGMKFKDTPQGLYCYVIDV